jgi:tripartite-type tricarboxylate transporter receptor subunit TctC
MTTLYRPALAGLAALCVLAASGWAAAQSPAEFYKGKQLTFIVGSSPGGGYDAQARLLARHFSKHMAGNPSIVVQNLPAAGSLQAANNLYNISPKDGSTFGMIQRGMLTATLTNPTGVRFDIAKFNWIGNMASETAVVVAWADSPIKTTEDLFTKEMIVGGTGPTIDTETTPRLLNALIGTKFKVISGYPGTTEVTLAMERGEVMGLGDWSWSNVKSRRGDYLRDKKIRVLMQSALEKEPDLPDVPLALDYVKNAEDRQIMELIMAQKTVARPLVAPPDVPQDRIAALRSAFMATGKDADFMQDADKSKLDIGMSSGEDVDKVVARIVKTPPALADKLSAAIAPPNR